MNLLLHGLEAPQIDPENSLRFRLSEIGDRDRVDVILTNPPFGGEEERGILGNFPEDKQTAETALLFLQLIMRKLRRIPKPGRAAVVVPNGTLFGDGVCARIKEELLCEFNLHTVVRLPNGIFAPYTGPEGRKNYSKTKPIQYEEFADCLKWWAKRQENERAWKVMAADVAAHGYNLDIKNPHAAEDLVHLPPEQLADDILKKEQRIIEIVGEIKGILLGGR
jgi:type I restriction enzyme M protein